LLDTLVSLHKELASKKNVSLSFELITPASHRNPATAYTVMGHDNRLGQVVANLLTNAISFAPEGSIIETKLKRVDNMVEFSIADNGPGIPPDNLEKIFQRFYTDRPESAFGKNSGLGLSISRQIVEAYRGTIFAANRRDRTGARFIVRIPAAPSSRKSRKKQNA